MKISSKHISSLFLASIIVVFGVSLYASTYSNQLFWDDNDFILNNRYVQDWQYLPNMFTGNVIEGAGLVSNYYRPVLLMVFAAEWHAWGGFPPPWHITNAVFHAANAVLLFYLLYSLWRRKWLAFFTAFVFLVHPLQTEAVAYVNSLGDSLSVFFMLSGLLLYVRYYYSTSSAWKSWTYYGSFILFPLALLSKETAIIMPALLFLVDFFLTDIAAFWKRVGLAFRRVWPFFVAAAVYVLLRATTLNFQNTFNLYNESNVFTESILVRIFTFFRIVWTYAQLLVWPHELHMERSVAVAKSLGSVDVLLGFLICIGLISVVVWQYRKRPILSFGILWFFICLAPTSNIAVPINGLLYEHWLYFPMIGFWLTALAGAVYLVKSITRSRIRDAAALLFFILVSVALIGFSIRTVLRNREWRDPVTLYTQTLKFAPTSYRVWNNLGMGYADLGNTDRAIASYEQAVSLDSTNPVALHNLGNAYQTLGNADRAMAYYEAAITADPAFIYSFNNLLNLYIRQGEIAKARYLLERYVASSPNASEFYDLLIQLAISESDYAGAVQYIDQAIDTLPKDPKNSDRAEYRNELLKQLPSS